MDLTAIRETWLLQLRRHRAIAVIRAATPDLGYAMAIAVAAGGMRLIEVAWTTPQAARLIAQLRAELPHCQIGVGTILSIEALRQAVDAGAQFVFSPHTNVSLMQAARQRPVIPGALSPSEVVAAWNAGAASVKVFPVTAVGGVAYIRALQGPLGHIPLVPTGGIALAAAPFYLEAGAIAVGLSTALFPKSALRTGAWEEITQQAQALTDKIAALG